MRSAARSACTAFMAALYFSAAAFAQPEAPPRPSLPSAGETLASVVDDATGAPLAGVNAVARWEWIDWVPPRLHGGGYYGYFGSAAHVAETLSDDRGAVRFAPWRSLPRADGRMAPGQPRLLFFLPGYEPLTIASADLAGKPARLRRFSGAPRGYGEAIARFQGVEDHGLAWMHPDGALQTPGMTTALHREKLRLRGEGAAIRGAHLLPGRSGLGEVLDSRTGGQVPGAIASITWTMRPAAGGEARRAFVQQKNVGADSSPLRVYISAWRPPGPRLEGWLPDEAALPLVRIYALGYRTSRQAPWPLEGAVVRMDRLPEGNEAKLAQLREWRQDIDAFVAAGEERSAAEQYARLAWKFQYECERLTPNLRAGLCYEADTAVARAAHALRMRPVMLLETFEVENEVAIVAAPRSVPQSAAQPAAAGGYTPRPPVRGFSIEPVAR